MLNEKIKTFDYGIVETSNRPSTITNLTLSSKDDNLKQSGQWTRHQSTVWLNNMIIW